MLKSHTWISLSLFSDIYNRGCKGCKGCTTEVSYVDLSNFIFRYLESGLQGLQGLQRFAVLKSDTLISLILFSDI